MERQMLIVMKRIVMNKDADRSLVWQDSVRPEESGVNGIPVTTIGFVSQCVSDLRQLPCP